MFCDDACKKVVDKHLSEKNGYIEDLKYFVLLSIIY